MYGIKKSKCWNSTTVVVRRSHAQHEQKTICRHKEEHKTETRYICISVKVLVMYVLSDEVLQHQRGGPQASSEKTDYIRITNSNKRFQAVLTRLSLTTLSGLKNKLHGGPSTLKMESLLCTTYAVIVGVFSRGWCFPPPHCHIFGLAPSIR